MQDTISIEKGQAVDLVTGATGFLGSHIASQLVENDRRVRALVRATSDTSFLDTLQVQQVVGNLSDVPSLERACEGIDTVFHTAAEVNDWGPWSRFYRNTVEGTLNLAKAALKAGVRRFVHVSTIGVYGHPTGDEAVFDETAPFGRQLHRWSYYSRAKAQAEIGLWKLQKNHGLPLTVIRPPWIYGPRDRIIVPRLHRLFKSGSVKLLGDGRNMFYAVFVTDLVNACLLAAQNEQAIGQAYNCADHRPITQKDFLALWANAFDSPPPERKVPYHLARMIGFMCECGGRLIHLKHAPFVTRYSVWVLGRRVTFPTDKIRRQLGWLPSVSHAEGVQAAAEWYLRHIEETS